MCGVGIGLVLSANGSTGGTDIIVMIINKYRNITPGRTMLLIDLAIVSSSYLIFHSVETIVYGIIIIAVMATSQIGHSTGYVNRCNFYFFFKIR